MKHQNDYRSMKNVKHRKSIWISAALGFALIWSISVFGTAHAETNPAWDQKAIQALAEQNNVTPEEVTLVSEWTVIPNDTSELEQTAQGDLQQKQEDLAAKQQELREAQIQQQNLQNELASIEQAMLSMKSKTLLRETYNEQLKEIENTIASLEEETAGLEEDIAQGPQAIYPAEIAYAKAKIHHPNFSLNKLVVVDTATGEVIPESEANTYPTVSDLSSQLRHEGFTEYTLNNPKTISYLAVLVVACVILLTWTEHHAKKSKNELKVHGGIHSDQFSA